MPRNAVFGLAQLMAVEHRPRQDFPDPRNFTVKSDPRPPLVSRATRGWRYYAGRSRIRPRAVDESAPAFSLVENI